MKLLRIVSATFDPDPKQPKSWNLQIGAVTISTIPIRSAPAVSGVRFLLKAETRISLPEIGEDGFVIIPDAERRQLEFALETVVNTFAVFGYCKRTLSSASPWFAPFSRPMRSPTLS